MSKIIRITDEMMKGLLDDFAHNLRSERVLDGKITFTKTFDDTNQKATVCFTEIAWIKMQTLVQEFEKEVAWYGVARREKDDYIIDDIVVYPQTVSSATVDLNTEEYATWMGENSGDDRFQHLRMQGHSHVNMSATASPTDIQHQKEIVSLLGCDDFYIFIILNKKQDKAIKIYDMQKNIVFDTSDITVKIIDNGIGLDSFLKDAKTVVKDATTTYYQNNYNSYGYGGYYSGYNSYCNNNTAPTNKDDVKSESTKSIVTHGEKKRKGKRKKGSKNTVNTCRSDSYGGY